MYKCSSPWCASKSRGTATRIETGGRSIDSLVVLFLWHGRVFAWAGAACDAVGASG